VLDQVQQGRHDLPASRAPLRSVGEFALRERLALRCRHTRRGTVHERLRHATQANVAGDRCRLAYRSRLHPGHLVAALVKALRGPAITPGLEHSPACPMQRLSHEKPRGVGPSRLRVRDHPPLAPLSLQPHGLGEHPTGLLLPMATMHPEGTQAFRVLALQRRCPPVYSTPLALPLDVTRALDRTAPRLPAAFTRSR
jgi:hypothetical protein